MGGRRCAGRRIGGRIRAGDWAIVVHIPGGRRSQGAANRFNGLTPWLTSAIRYISIKAAWHYRTQRKSYASAKEQHSGDMSNILKYIPTLGLKAGIYTDAGVSGCSYYGPDLGPRLSPTQAARSTTTKTSDSSPSGDSIT